MENIDEIYQHNLRIMQKMVGGSDHYLSNDKRTDNSNPEYEKYRMLEWLKCLDEFEKNPDNAANICKIGDFNHYFGKYKEAVDFYNKAVALGNAEAIAKVALHYQAGYGVEHNDKVAFDLFKQAASLGDQKSLYAIGSMLLEGIGVEQNTQLAYEYFNKCLENGNDFGYRGLGLYYEKCLKDNKTAIKYYQKALDVCPDTIEDIKRINPNYFESKDLDPVSLYIIGKKCYQDDNYGKAVEYLQPSADYGYPKAQYLLGMCYKDGKGIEKNDPKAFELFKEAAEQDYSDALIALSYMYQRGCYVKKDKVKALELCTKAANLGSEQAKFIIDCSRSMFEDIKTTSVSAEEAFNAAKSAFSQDDYYKALDYADLYPNDAKLQSLSGDCFFQLQKYGDAFECFSKSAQQDCVDGLLGLGFCYENGYGTKKDKSKAEECYQKCINRNDPQGFYYMGMMLLQVNPEDAYPLLINAAKAGVKNAFIGLGNYYYEHLHNRRSAVKYFKMSENPDYVLLADKME